MAGRSAAISVSIKGEAEFDQARREIAADLDKIERAASDITLTPELDSSEIRKALDLAKQLDGLTAELTVDADITDIQQAEALAKSLRGFQARVDLSVEGRAELVDALNLAEQMDRLRQVKVEVQGRQDLERAAQIADDLERRRTVQVDVDDSAIAGAGDKLGRELTAGGEEGAAGVADALGGIDYADIGSAGLDKLSGALGAAGPWGAVGAGVGAIFGESLLDGFNNALPSGRADTIRALRNNLPESDLRVVGEAGGAAYSAGLSDGLTEAKDAAALIKGELGAIDDDLDLTKVTRQALALERVFAVDLADSVASVDKLVSQGLVKNSAEGFNLLFELGQQTGTQFDEMLELTNEFSTAIKALGIDGPKGLKLIGDMVEQGIFPQVDQAGEVFEELNETIISGGAAEAMQQLGVDAKNFTADIAAGGPLAASAVAEISKQLLAVDDNAEQAQLTAAIFGGNMGLLGDEAREAALQLFATSEATAEVGTGASAAATAIEESASGLDRLKKAAVGLGEELGGIVADGLDTLNALAELDFSAAASSAADLGEAIAVKMLGPVGALTGPVDELADKIGFDLPNAFDLLDGKIEGVAEATGPAVAGAEALSTAAREGVPKMEELADASGELAGGLDDSAQSADELEAELRGLFDFSADQLFRDIADEAERLAETLADGGAKAVEMSGDIDITSKSGRELQAQLENINGVLIDAEVAYANQEISAAQLSDVHTSLRAQLENAGKAAGLTSTQIQTLTDKYLSVPDSVTTELRAIDNATAVVRNLQTALAGLKDKTITVTTRNTIIAATAATAKARARGGWTDGLTLVGEEGPELIDVRGRAFVHTAAETRELMSNRGSDLGGSGPALPAARGRAFIENATFIVDKGVDLWQQADLAELVYGARR
jgi:hypothetical protein